MDIRIVISADEKALEFARNLGKLFSAYVSQSDIEAGLVGKFGGVNATIEPDTMPWEDEVEKGRAYADAAQKAAEANAQKAIEEHNKKVAETTAPVQTPPVQEAPAATPEPAKPAANLPIPTVNDLKAKAATIGSKFGREKFFELKAAMKVESMSALNDQQRADFGKYLDDFLANH